jgi:hypothetical protein
MVMLVGVGSSSSSSSSSRWWWRWRQIVGIHHGDGRAGAQPARNMLWHDERRVEMELPTQGMGPSWFSAGVKIVVLLQSVEIIFIVTIIIIIFFTTFMRKGRQVIVQASRKEISVISPTTSVGKLRSGVVRDGRRRNVSRRGERSVTSSHRRVRSLSDRAPEQALVVSDVARKKSHLLAEGTDVASQG